MLPTSEDTVVIPLSKVKIALLLFGSLIFIVGSFWLWFISAVQNQYPTPVVQAAAVVSISFFGLCGAYGVAKLFNAKPGLVLDKHGIIDNSSGVSAGRIPWDEIINISTQRLQKHRFLTIQVTTPQKYVERGGWFKRKLNAANLKYYGSPIHISSTTLDMDFDTLSEVVTEYYERFGNASQVIRQPL